MEIELLRADITSVKVDAIVNPSFQAKGPAGTLVNQGGKLVNYQNESIRNAPVGSAVVTTGGNLLCKFIIHAVGPRMGEGDEDQKLRNATWSALQRAEELAIASVAFPSMSAAVFGFPLERGARVMLSTTIDFKPRARSLRRAVYCLFGEEAFRLFGRVLEELQP